MATRAHTPRRKARPTKGKPMPARRWLLITAGVLLLGAAAIGGLFAYAAWWPTVRPRHTPHVLHVPTGSDYATLRTVLDTAGVITDWAAFEFMAEQMGLPQLVKPGRYRLDRPEGTRAFIHRLRLGLQSPVQLRVPVRRTLEGMAKAIGAQLECGPDSLRRAWSRPDLADSLGTDAPNLIGVFIPNSYEVYWNVSPEALARRLLREHARFWDSTRVALAAAQNLTPQQVSVLASIVEGETYRDDERARVAGVYLNRLRRGMLLQADPTVIFAHRDWTIRRVLKRHLSIDSPYNTYRYAGLPPGPINAPSVASLEAVLAPEQHNYLYFAARASLDGYHNFSETYREHLEFAADYQAEMNAQARRKRQEAATKAAADRATKTNGSRAINPSRP